MIRESRMNGPRKAQDILVALKLTVRGGLAGSYAAFADELGMSASEVHAAVRTVTTGGFRSRLQRTTELISDIVIALLRAT